jgi:outer membrane protein TolC
MSNRYRVRRAHHSLPAFRPAVHRPEEVIAMATRTIIAIAVSAVLGGCATFSPDGGFGAVEESTKSRLGATAKWQRTDADREEVLRLVNERLAKPLGPDDAVQLALLNNPGLQATFAELGVAEADMVTAGRLPAVRIASLRTKYGESVEKVEQSIGTDVLGLLLLPIRYKYESQRFARVQADVARETLAVAYETRRAWFEAVASAETVRYMRQVREAAEVSAELARRMARAGNYSKLQQMREQVFYAEATAQLARAMQASVAARERLTRLLGVPGEHAFTLPERLPDLPAAPAATVGVAENALRERLDIQASQRQLESLRQSLGLVKTTRFVNALEVGRARTKEGDHPFAYGWEFSIEIPIFDFGASRVAQAEALYMQGVSRMAETALNASSEVRQAYSAYRAAFDTARHYREEIVPLRKRISEENVLRYNGMLISVFELLADAREQVSAVNAAIDATREYWLAETDLQAALTGAGSAARASARSVSPMPVAQTAGGH